MKSGPVWNLFFFSCYVLVCARVCFSWLIRCPRCGRTASFVRLVTLETDTLVRVIPCPCSSRLAGPELTRSRSRRNGSSRFVFFVERTPSAIAIGSVFVVFFFFFDDEHQRTPRLYVCRSLVRVRESRRVKVLLLVLFVPPHRSAPERPASTHRHTGAPNSRILVRAVFLALLSASGTLGCSCETCFRRREAPPPPVRRRMRWTGLFDRRTIERKNDGERTG